MLSYSKQHSLCNRGPLSGFLPSGGQGCQHTRVVLRKNQGTVAFACWSAGSLTRRSRVLGLCEPLQVGMRVLQTSRQPIIISPRTRKQLAPRRALPSHRTQPNLLVRREPAHGTYVLRGSGVFVSVWRKESTLMVGAVESDTGTDMRGTKVPPRVACLFAAPAPLLQVGSQGAGCGRALRVPKCCTACVRAAAHLSVKQTCRNIAGAAFAEAEADSARSVWRRDNPLRQWKDIFFKKKNSEEAPKGGNAPF